MRRAVPFVAAGLLVSGLLCLEQQPRAYWQSVQQVSVGTSFTGEGDILSGALAYGGVRAYNAAYSGNILDLCDQATGLVCSTATWAAASGITLPLIGGVACNNVTNICVVSKAYDTSGAGGSGWQQATNSKRPTLIIPAASNGCPTDGAYCLGLVRASTQCLTTTDTFTQAQPLGFTYVATRTGTTNATNSIISFGTANTSLQFSSTANQVNINFGTLQAATANDSAWHAVVGTGSNTAGQQTVDGSAMTANNGTGSPSAVAITIGALGSGCAARAMDGKLVSWGFYPSDPVASAAALNANMHAYPSAW